MFRRWVFRIATPMVESLINDSIKDKNLKDFVSALFVLLVAIVNVLTDNNKDNSAQVKQVLVENLSEFLTEGQNFALSLFDKNK